MNIQGGCLCGRVRYEVTGQLYDTHHCHCSMCRRHHGSAFSTSAKLTPGEFNWLSGEDLVKVYQSSPGIGWGFCSECGSSLVGTNNGEIIMVTLGTIDGDPGPRADSHIFVGSKAEWHDITDNIPQFKKRSNTG